MNDSNAPFTVTPEHMLDWLERYELAWRSPGTAALGRLFTDDASYVMAPYDPPVEGVAAISEMWERERDGPDEQFSMTSEIVAIGGDTAVARIEVMYAGPPERQYRDLWVVRFDCSGLCRWFEEWPFWPGQPLAQARG